MKMIIMNLNQNMKYGLKKVCNVLPACMQLQN